MYLGFFFQHTVVQDTYWIHINNENLKLYLEKMKAVRITRLLIN